SVTRRSRLLLRGRGRAGGAGGAGRAGEQRAEPASTGQAPEEAAQEPAAGAGAGAGPGALAAVGSDACLAAATSGAVSGLRMSSAYRRSFSLRPRTACSS